MEQSDNKQTVPFSVGCRYCGRTDVELRRGLCDAHYQRFIRKRKAMAAVSASKAEDFEQRCVELGWIESPQQRGRPTARDAFDDIAAEVMGEFDRDITAAVARENAREAKAAVKKRSTKKSDRKAE